MWLSRLKVAPVLFLSLAYLTFIGASSVWAQGRTAEPQTVLLTPEGVVNVQDLPPAGPRVPVHREMPFRVPDMQELLGTKARHEAKTQPAPGASATVTGPTLLTLSPTTGFIGLHQSESGGWRPPDTQVGVGPNHIVEAVNLEMRIWQKNGTLVKSTDLNTFFGTSANLSDPKIRFDPLSNRWFIAVISYNNSFTAGAWRLAVSTTDDPTGIFVRYTASTSKSAPDFPALGVSNDKVVLTANAFRGNSFVGTEFLVINKAHLTAGTSAASKFFAPPQGLFTVQPAQSLSPTNTLYMASVAYNSATSVRIWSVIGLPGVSSVTFSTANVSITSLTSPPNASQAGTSTLIETNDNRLLDAVYRGDKLWISANSACVPSGDSRARACLRLMQFTIVGNTITKAQDFDFGQPGYYYYYPAVQIDGIGNLISVFSGSSGSLYAGVYASGQRLTDGANTFQGPVLVKPGEGAYTTTRWGDYSGAAIDPFDSTQATVWVAGEYALPITNNNPEWGTWLAPLQMQ